MRLRIGIDIDGVGFNFGDSCKAHMDHTGLGHLWKSGPTPDPYWDFYKDWGWTTDRFVEFCNEAADCGCLFSGPVKDGYVEMIESIARLGHEIIIITDRSFGSNPSVSHNLTCEWLAQHGIEYDELIFSSDKTCVKTDMFIDDKIQNYDALVAAGSDAYLLNRPWNHVPFEDHRKRIDTLDEYTGAVEVRTAANSYLL